MEKTKQKSDDDCVERGESDGNERIIVIILFKRSFDLMKIKY
jgi:hypothetical protein